MKYVMEIKTNMKEAVDKGKESSNDEESLQAVKCYENCLQYDQCD